MRRSIGACVLAGAVLLSIVPASAGERKVPARSLGGSTQDRSKSLLSAPAPGDFVPGEVLVTFEPQVARATRSAAVTRSVEGAELDAKVTPTVAVVEVPTGTNVQAAAARLHRDPTVAWAEPNWYRQPLVLPNDPALGLQWGLTKANVTSAWDTEAGDEGTVIAIIDTGVDADHPDLVGNLWTNDETPGNGVDDDGNGYEDDIYGWDFLQNDATPQDVDDHGTHVAGIAAAEWDNGQGGSGVCPECSLMILRAGNGAGFASGDVVEAVRYAADNGADVINLSIGGPQWGKAERNALKYAIGKGSLIVAAAGNEDRNNDTIDYSPGFPYGPSYPASYDLPGVISVAASTVGDGYAGFSNVGRYSVDLAAPGAGIYSTVPNDTYATFNGTSMSSPFVAGLAGLLRAANPSMTPVQTKNAILNGIDKPGLKSGRSLTNGRVNAFDSISAPDTSNATPKHDGVMSGAVSIGFKKSGKVSVPADHNDIYKKRLRKGKVYAALLKVPASRDFDLFVWKPGTQDTFPTTYGCGGFSCFLRGVSTNGKGADEYVRFKATKAGVYYFHVNAFKGGGKYTLLVGVSA